MQPKIALFAAIACAAVAVGAVSLDVVYSLEARLEQKSGGEWSAVTGTKGDRYVSPVFYPGCTAEPLRLVVDNHRPLATSVDVKVYAVNGTTNKQTVLLKETWHLAAFAVQMWDVPETPNLRAGSPKSASETPHPMNTLYAEIDDVVLTACLGVPA